VIAGEIGQYAQLDAVVLYLLRQCRHGRPLVYDGAALLPKASSAIKAMTDPDAINIATV
jgi:hypothetical protein